MAPYIKHQTSQMKCPWELRESVNGDLEDMIEIVTLYRFDP